MGIDAYAERHKRMRKAGHVETARTLASITERTDLPDFIYKLLIDSSMLLEYLRVNYEITDLLTCGTWIQLRTVWLGALGQPINIF